MELWLDSAEISEINEVFTLARIKGVTTNPTLAKRAGVKTYDEYRKNYLRIARSMYSAGPYPTSYQLVKLPPVHSIWDTISEGLEIYASGLSMATEGTLFQNIKKPLGLLNNVVIKIPMMKQNSDMSQWLIRQFKNHNIPINTTLVFNLFQAHLAADAGADYVSVFVGRIEDQELENRRVQKQNKNDAPTQEITDFIERFLEEIQNMLVKFSYPAKLLVGSVRHKQHVRSALKVGVPILTAPLKILKELSYDPLTDTGYDLFQKDAPDIKPA